MNKAEIDLVVEMGLTLFDSIHNVRFNIWMGFKHLCKSLLAVVSCFLATVAIEDSKAGIGRSSVEAVLNQKLYEENTD